jgi:hypothetical protein
MAQSWRNYAAYYVVPGNGQRDVRDISGELCDAQYHRTRAEDDPLLGQPIESSSARTGCSIGPRTPAAFRDFRRVRGPVAHHTSHSR